MTFIGRTGFCLFDQIRHKFVRTNFCQNSHPRVNRRLKCENHGHANSSKRLKLYRNDLQTREEKTCENS